MSNEEKIVVWGSGTPRTFRVLWALHELGAAYDLQRIKTRTADMDSDEFMAVSPGKKIPALQHGSTTLVESGAIVFHLYNHFSLEEHTDRQVSEILKWSFFALMELDATALYVMRRHRDLPNIYGDAPAAVSASGEYFDRQSMVVADALSDGREFLVGHSLTAADIFMVSCCGWAIAYGLTLPAALANYYAKLSQRDGYIEASEVNQAAL